MAGNGSASETDMKFAAKLTKRKSEIAGLDACRASAEAGTIKRYVLPPLDATVEGAGGFWRRVDACHIQIEGESDPAVGALVVEGMLLRPREPVLEELTRHKQTMQAFIPCNGPILVPVVRSSARDDEQPDPLSAQIVPCVPGEAIIVEKGIWHTLPFTFVGMVKTITVVHRLPPETYHEVRDLPAEGWFGEIVWS